MRITAAPWSSKYCIVGMAALIRVSSVMCSSASRGTLKSTRTSTRLPATWMSRMVFLFIIYHSRLKAFLCNEVCQVGNAARVTPLVIVPGENFNHIATKDHSQESIDDRGVRIATEVGRNKRLLRIFKNAFERTSRGYLESIVNGFPAGLFTDSGHEINH